eukprot:COSAG01_NODE_6325_length_3734_cov_3.565062_2_plen_118_part_00
MTFQLDSGGSYTRSDMAPFAGPTRGYRRIEGLERDPLVAAFLAHPLVGEIYGRYYGDTVLRRRCARSLEYSTAPLPRRRHLTRAVGWRARGMRAVLRGAACDGGWVCGAAVSVAGRS